MSVSAVVSTAASDTTDRHTRRDRRLALYFLLHTQIPSMRAASFHVLRLNKRRRPRILLSFFFFLNKKMDTGKTNQVLAPKVSSTGQQQQAQVALAINQLGNGGHLGGREGRGRLGDALTVSLMDSRGQRR